MTMRSLGVIALLPLLSVAVMAAEPAKKESARPETKELSFAAEMDQEMKRCVELWDKATNMTRAKWREVCNRTLGERLQYRRASRAGAALPHERTRKPVRK